MLMDFTNKTAIVTGSARGIGKVIAERLAKAGANVVISDVDHGAIDATVAGIGGRALGVKANVTVSAEIDNLCDKAVEK